MNARLLLFASVHSYLDPSSGAAMASREVLELLALRGWDCRALTRGLLDYQRETTMNEVLATLELPASRASAALSRGGSAEVIDLELGGVRVTLLPTHSSRPEKSPNPREGAVFLDLAGQVFDRFRPDVLLTYGGHPVSQELMRRARACGIAVVFHLHNFGYNSRRGFAEVSAVIFLSALGRVAMEAMANGIPVLASDRGALPETLGNAGFVFAILDRCTPGGSAAPTALEVAPWVAAIERLWDDPVFEARHSALARAEAQRWEWNRVADRYGRFFEGLVNPTDERNSSVAAHALRPRDWPADRVKA